MSAWLKASETRAAYRSMLDDIDTELAQLDDLWTRAQIASSRLAA